MFQKLTRRRFIATSLVALVLVSAPLQAAITSFTITVAGTPDAADLSAAKLIVDAENARRTALTPPGTPLPFGTAAEKRASYLTALEQVLKTAHASYIQQGRELDNASRKKAFETAPQNVQDQVDALLAPYARGSFVLPREWQRFRVPAVSVSSYSIAA